MKVLLQEHIEGVGHLGDVLEVSDGFARNFLLPRKKAIEASERNVKEFEHHRRIVAEKARKEKVELEAHARSISAVSLTFTMQAGKDGKLFGSVTSKDIEEGLAEKGFTIDRKKIQLPQPIKALGTVAIAIRLHRDVTATVSVEVARKQGEEAPTSEASEEDEAQETHEKAEKKGKAEKKDKKERKEKKDKKGAED
ncbi:MAG TPA: 50S ribosomal protein L9 [Nitrospiraceae bacterium]|jgi:large subunit ribosomal protein L9